MDERISKFGLQPARIKHSTREVLAKCADEMSIDVNVLAGLLIEYCVNYSDKSIDAMASDAMFLRGEK